jgi:hypothetical protein
MIAANGENLFLKRLSSSVAGRFGSAFSRLVAHETWPMVSGLFISCAHLPAAAEERQGRALRTGCLTRSGRSVSLLAA